MTQQSSVTDRLVGLIQNMSRTDQEWLLEFLEEKERPERRDCSRNKCRQTPVDWSGTEAAHTDFIRDVSTCGAFIETQRPVRTGQDVCMILSVPELNMPLKVTGQVVRSDRSGMGIQFKTGHRDLGMFLKYL